MNSDRDDYVIRVDELPRGENASTFDGYRHGAQVSFFLSHNKQGTGPGLHRHPYEETFVVQEGAAEFTVAGETVEVHAGTIVVVPAGAIHSFKAASDGVTRLNIHPVAEMVTEWIE